MLTNSYLQSWLPRQMGFHLGSWHRKGFVHGYAHAQNWTMAGTLIDDDSAREKTQFNLMNDDERKSYDGYMVYDLIRTFGSIIEIFDAIRDQGLSNTQESRLKQEQTLFNALEAMLLEYIKVVFPQHNSLPNKIIALRKLLDQELPNPHFDAMRDEGGLETLAVSKLRDREEKMWVLVLDNLSKSYIFE